MVQDAEGAHGRSRRDVIMVTYTDKYGVEKEKKSIGYNPFLKTKLIGVLGTSFLRAGKDAKYAAIYYDYKNRQANRPDCQELRPVILHRRAIRYAVKMFLSDLWYAWRELEGLPTGDPYEVAKLGMPKHHDPRDTSQNPDIASAKLTLMDMH